MRSSEFLPEGWSKKYKRSIDCSNPKGFSQRAHCQGRKKNEGAGDSVPGEWVYHASDLPDLDSGILSLARGGLKPSTDGQMGPGVYFAYTPDGGYYHVGEEDATLLRVRWRDLVRLYGTYPDVEDGIQRDSEQIIVPGPVPQEYIEVEYFEDEWWPLTTAARSIRSQRSINEATSDGRVVYFDMDGVLADFNGGYRARFGRDPAPSGIDHNITGLKGSDFFSTLDKLPGADQMIGAAVELFGGYSICSSPLRDDYSNSQANKTVWIREHLTPQPDSIVITGKKDSYARGKNILIDDRADNIERWRGRGGIGILYSAYKDDWRDVIGALREIKGSGN